MVGPGVTGIVVLVQTVRTVYTTIPEYKKDFPKKFLKELDVLLMVLFFDNFSFVFDIGP